MAKKLVAFYSREDENYVNGMIQTLETGNTEIAAGMIQELTGADLFKIEQITNVSRRHRQINREMPDQN